MAHQFVAAQDETFAGDRQDCAAQVGEVQVRDAYDLSATVTDRSAIEPDVERRGGHADASLEHELPRRVEWAEIRDVSDVRASLLPAEARHHEDFLAGRAGQRRDRLQKGQTLGVDL